MNGRIFVVENLKALTVPLLALFVTGCATMPSTQQLAAQSAAGRAEPKPPAVLTSAQIQIVQRGVRDGLKDPASAMFRGDYWAAGIAGGPFTVCGWVNARNSFGGYTGYGPFVGLLRGSTFTLADVSVGDTKAEVIMAFCRAEGAAIR